jgi:hypothetical protein
MRTGWSRETALLVLCPIDEIPIVISALFFNGVAR